MSSSSLGRVLVQLGLTLATRGPVSRLRNVALAAGTALLVLGLGGLVLTGSYAALRQERTLATSPTPAPAGAVAPLLTEVDGFTSVGDRPVAVISIWPLREDAPLPPGIAHWSAPGEAVLSPTLLHDLGPSRADLFGRVAGTIGPSGLEVPTERRVYLRPTTAAFDPSTMQPTAGFGHPAGSAGVGVGSLYANAGWMVMALVLAALVAPALVALALATSLDGDVRDRRTGLLTALGAGRRHRALVEAAEALPALLVGAGVGAAWLGLLCVVDVRLPPLDALLAADAARRVAPELAGAVVAGVVLAVATVVAVRERPRPRRHRRPSAVRAGAQSPWARTVLFFVTAATTIGYTYTCRNAELRSLAYIGGALVVAVTLPAVVAVLLTLTGRLAGDQALRRRSAGTLAGGRRLQRFPERTARLALGLSFGILLVGQVQLWSSSLGAQYYHAIDVRARVGDTVAFADHTTYGPALTRYAAALPSTARPAWVAVTPPESGTGRPGIRLTGPCVTLRTLGLACSDGIVAVDRPNTQLGLLLMSTGDSQRVDVTVAESPDQPTLERQQATFVVVSPTVDGLPMDRLQRAAYAIVPGGLQLETMAQNWVIAGHNVRLSGHWTVLLGSLGLAIVALAGTCALAGDVLGGGAALTRLSRLSARTRWVHVLTLWRTAVPLMLGAALGAAVYLVLPIGIGHRADIDGVSIFTPSPTLAIASVLAAAVLAGCVSTWAARRLTR